MNKSTPVKRRKSAPKFWVIKNGRLYARLQYTDETGKSRDKYRSISDKRQARNVVENMRREFQSLGSEMLNAEKLTFKEVAESFSESKLIEPSYSNGIKISGRRSLSAPRAELKPLIKYFGSRMLRSIKPADLEFFKKTRLSQITKRGTLRKLATVNRELALLRTIFNFAFQNDWIIQSPFSKVKGIISLSAEVERNRVLSLEEEERLLSVCTDRRSHLRGILICALDTAMRRGEIFKMKWQEIDFESNKIRIPQTNTKTEEARTVGMTPRLRKELDKLWQASPQDRSLSVFGITNTIKTSFNSACKDADIHDFRFHDCRHTATTRMIASGSPHTEVMKITGHTQIKTFLRYLNITTETANKVASRLDEYLSNRTSPMISERMN